MIVEDQQAATAFLLDAASYRAAGPVEAIETHISLIFLVGQRAYKMKRAVKLPYVDFSTPALGLAACEKEVELNSKTAPGLYLGVRRITREADGKLAFDGMRRTGRCGDRDGPLRSVEAARPDGVAGELTPALMTADRAHDRALSTAARRWSTMAAARRIWRACSTSTRRALPPAMFSKETRSTPFNAVVPRRARAPFSAARPARGSRQGAPLPRRSASAQHLPFRRRAAPVRLHRVQRPDRHASTSSTTSPSC